MNEAAFYLSFLPEAIEKNIVIRKSVHPRRKETLAEYYFRTYRHLLGKIGILEYDTDTKTMKLIGENPF